MLRKQPSERASVLEIRMSIDVSKYELFRHVRQHLSVQKGDHFMSKSSERGQALILIALAAIGLFAFSALAIDGSRQFSNKRNAQNAADTAVLAAALTQVRTGNFNDAQLAAQDRATSNGYTHDGVNTIVEIDLCSNVVCEGLPAGLTAAQQAEYIRVKIVSTIPTTFARVIGRDTVTAAGEAIARVQTSSSTSSSGGEALVGLRQTGCSICANGNVNLDVNGSGIFSNSTTSTGDCSMDFEGNGIYQSDGGYTVASGGALCRAGNVNVNGNIQSGAQKPYPPSISISAPGFACPVDLRDINSATVQPDGTIVYPPGTYNAHLNLNGVGNYVFAPGTFCFNGGATINGIINVTANNVNIRIGGSSFQINGNSKLTCSNVLIHGTAGTGIEFNGNATNNCNGITFFMESGKVTWNGNVAQQFSAPTGGTYKGLLIYLPYGNNAGLTINGNSGNQLTGSIIAPSSEIVINGNSGTAGLRSQIIGYYVTLNGNSNTTINFDPNLQYGPPASPTIELTK
jgi:Flp pilus assembly protein TadG